MLLSTFNTQLGLSSFWLQDQLRKGSIPICYCDPQDLGAGRNGRVLATSRVIRSQNDKVDQTPKSTYLTPDLTNGFKSVLVTISTKLLSYPNKLALINRK